MSSESVLSECVCGITEDLNSHPRGKLDYVAGIFSLSESGEETPIGNRERQWRRVE